MTQEKQYWFPAKKYGWGWGFPKTWPGLLVSGAYFGLLMAAIPFIGPDKNPMHFVYYVGVLSVALIAICWIKGEPPRWRWGDKPPKD